MSSASKLVQVRQQLSALSERSTKLATQLLATKQSFTQTISAVQGTIGGSARKTDLNMVAALQAAEKKLEEAAAALQHASSEGKKFASTL
ncbi:hypothetical protein [Cryptosporangium phraense]|uniref:Uncharacterized protein n=1 Tax=Cryptosporangium phraense TaxID=2593070 RepID=A0A545AMB1_9ACTN|nr:hypothetical protein [Cryptosporangium phraense]TQS42453.1 hypothetical protein FL583_24410 [Cryptosporangium phraense]